MPPSIFCPDTTWTGTQILLSEQHCGINQAFCENRLLVEGDLDAAMHLVRALEQLQSLILPAFIARPLLRHYPDPHRKLARACHIYLGLLTG